MSSETRNVTWQIAKAPQIVTASPSTISVPVGSSERIALSFFGDGIASAQSSNTAVVTVSGSGTSFTVSGVGVGNATVMFRVSESTNYQSGAMAVEVAVVHNIVYIGVATPISVSKENLAGARAGNYALLAGGYNATSPAYYATVDSYDTDLTHAVAENLAVGRENLSGATAGDLAVFAGGNYSGGGHTNTVDVYSSDLAKITPSAQLSLRRSSATTASNGNYAIFAGGYDGLVVNNVDAYNALATHSTPTALSLARYHSAGAAAGAVSIFAGGFSNSYTNVADWYNAELTRGTPTTISVARGSPAGASTSSYAIFAAGQSIVNSTATLSGTVDAFDSNLTRQNPQEVTPRKYLAGAKTGDYAVFAGGETSMSSQYYPSDFLSIAEAFDNSLTKQTPAAMSTGRSHLAGATNGKHAIFGGGTGVVNNAWVYYDEVDVYLG